MQIQNNHLPKVARLCSKKEIAELFQNGQSFLIYPIRCTWKPLADDSKMSQVMVIAPKRNHKLAVNRNLIKRRMREAYRLSTWKALPPMEIALHYIAKGEPLKYRIIDEAIKKIIEKIGNCTTDSVD